MDNKGKSDKKRTAHDSPWGKTAFGIVVVCCVMLVRWSLVFDTHGSGVLSGPCANYVDSSGRVVDCSSVSLFGFPRDLFDLVFAFEILGMIQSGRIFLDRLMRGGSMIVVGAVFLGLAALFPITFFVANFRGR
jgi:hypothetical protein